MTHTPVPRRLLLATDLSSRCDRAMDRALLLAKAWNAELHVVHRIPDDTPPPSMRVSPDRFRQYEADRRDVAERELRRSLGPAGEQAVLHLETRASPAQAILSIASHEACELIILGEPRQRLIEPIGETTLERVVRAAPASVLVVRDRVHGPYRRLLVGTDLSEEARKALIHVSHLFSDASVTLLHAFTLPRASVIASTSEGLDWRSKKKAALRRHLDAAELVAERKDRIRTVVEAGSPGPIMRQYMRTHGADLSVIGAYPRGAFYNAFIGNSRRIINGVQGDVLIVRSRLESEPRASRLMQLAATSMARAQSPDAEACRTPRRFAHHDIPATLAESPHG